MKIGVLALQGGFIEHGHKLTGLGVQVVEVRLPEHLSGLKGLIIPGGESTTIAKLAIQYGLMEPLRSFASRLPTWGTCAGLIFLAKDAGRDQPLLGVMDISVQRNAFGRQVDSFVEDISVPVLEDGARRRFPAIFIRAPKIAGTGRTTEIIAKLDDGTPVAVRQGNLLATAFHPELSSDDRFHRYFLWMCSGGGEQGLRFRVQS